jgi:threonine/homoserine/homoserine lactone efflux protein
MNLNSQPPLNNIYSTFIILLGISTGGLFLYFAAQDSTDTPTSLMLLAFAILAIAGSIYFVYSAARIRVTRCGISSGKKQIQWQSVTQIETIGYGIHIHAADKKIVIAPWAYQDPEALISFIRVQFQEQANK